MVHRSWFMVFSKIADGGLVEMSINYLQSANKYYELSTMNHELNIPNFAP